MQNNSDLTEKITLEGRKYLSINNVESVDGYNEQVLRLTVNGSKMTVSGDKIKITAFNKASGSLTAEGQFVEFKFNRKKVPIVKRLFK